MASSLRGIAHLAISPAKPVGPKIESFLPMLKHKQLIPGDLNPAALTCSHMLVPPALEVDCIEQECVV